MCVCVCVFCVCVCVCVCVPRKRFFKTIVVKIVLFESSDVVIIVELGTVTASDMRMHHVLIILTMTFIQGRKNRNHENNKYFIISETIQVMPITFAVKVCI